MMIREIDPAHLLLCALRRHARAVRVAATVAHESQAPWFSATFVGGQHVIAVTGRGLDAWLDLLPDADLPMHGHFVASCAVARHDGGALLTVLVLEE